MKINVVPTIIAVAISALLSFALYVFCRTEGQEILLSICGFVCLFVPLAICLGVRFTEGHTSVNTVTLGSVFFLLLLASHAIFAFLPHFTMPAYIITNGVILLTFLLIVYAIVKAKQ